MYLPENMISNRKGICSPSAGIVSLGDLVLAVGNYSKDSAELAAAVSDLLNSGAVRLCDNGQPVRAQVVRAIE